MNISAFAYECIEIEIPTSQKYIAVFAIKQIISDALDKYHIKEEEHFGLLNFVANPKNTH